MAKFLTTAGCSYEIEQLVLNAKDKLYFISPYLSINKLLKTKIKDLDNKANIIDIKIVCRKDKINADDMAFLQERKNVIIYALDNLHAKCYINQDTAIITSLNLYQFSEHNNREMGIRVDKNTDPELYKDIFYEVGSIIGESNKYELTMKKQDIPVPPKEAPKKPQSVPTLKSGFCIRCGQDIAFNIEKPLCNTCYQSWAKYGDPSYPEKYCLICGKDSKQSYEKPVCYSCYKKNLK